VSPELLNNIGVLRLEVGNIKEAEESFKKAIDVCNQIIQQQNKDNLNRTYAIKITCRFNLGYC
jgi:hypothetical protein